MNRRSVSKFQLFVYPQAGHQTRCLALVCSFLLVPLGLRASETQEPSSHTPGSLATKVAESIRTVVRDRASSVVRVRCRDDHGEVVGTGFYIDPTGNILTLAEIVRDAQEITVEQPDDKDGIKSLPATVTAIDLRSGVAFLKVATGSESASFVPPLSISNPPELTPAIALGYPQEHQVTPALGMITGSKNHEGEIFLCVPHLTASLPLSEGEGGAPVLDLNGNLLGIIITGNTQLGTCTILPSAAIEQLHHNLMRYGGINPGWVGAVVEIAAVPQNNSRTRILSVAPGSPAEAAGIKPGDILLKLGTHAVHTPEDVLEASFYLSAGEDIHLSVLRKGVTQNLSLRCGEQPSLADDQEAAASPPTTLLGESAH